MKGNKEGKRIRSLFTYVSSLHYAKKILKISGNWKWSPNPNMQVINLNNKDNHPFIHHSSYLHVDHRNIDAEV
jgi:hypothetical protein